jgi:hypothetical protein
MPLHSLLEGIKLQTFRPVREYTQMGKGMEPYCPIPTITSQPLPTPGDVWMHAFFPGPPLGKAQVASQPRPRGRTHVFSQLTPPGRTATPEEDASPTSRGPEWVAAQCGLQAIPLGLHAAQAPAMLFSMGWKSKLASHMMLTSGSYANPR